MPVYIEIEPGVTVPCFRDEEAAKKWMYTDVDDPCIDNYRFTYADDPIGVVRYMLKQNEGCCGAFDRTVLIVDREAKIGCNFGH